ncbi:hypothetical protein BH20ACI1_BH20ACI1_12000 [soil metagenome]
MFKLQRLEITGFKSFADYTEIVFTGSGITAVVGPNGCGKCVSGDTRITLSDGREIEIRELVESALSSAFLREKFDDGFLTRENFNNIEILSLNPQTLKLEARKVSAFIKRETTKKLLHIRTRSGREIKATPYHPLFTLENGELRALRADELKTGVKIAVPRLLPTKNKEIEFSNENYLKSFDSIDNIFVPFSDSLKLWTEKGKKHFGSFAEWSQRADVPALILRGLRGGQSINIAELNKLFKTVETVPPFEKLIKSHQTAFLKLPETFSPDLARFLGLLIAEGRNTSASQVWFVNSDEAVNCEFERLANEIFNVRVVQKNYKKGTVDSLIFSQSLCKTLEKVFSFPINSNSFEKAVPPQIFQAETETKWAFLSGLFEGDAYVCSRLQKSNGKKLNYIEYTTASEKLAKQVVSLLLQLGISAYLRPKQKYASNTIEKKTRQYFSVLIYGSRQLKYAAENLHFVGEKQKSLEKLKNIDISDNPNRDLIPSATELVRKAVNLAKVKIKPNRREFPKIAAYTGKSCEASRNGLIEVIGQIKSLSENPKPAEEILERLSILANSDVLWDEIVEINEIEPTEDWVYDLSIDETHNFVAGNIIVHNSNVSDSIAWVLGEQRAKSLRGEDMKDVVFQGTSKRKASGMAEVVLHLVRDDETLFESDEEELGDIDETLTAIDEKAVDVDIIEAQQIQTENLELETAQAAQVGSIQTVQKKIKTKRHWKSRSFALEFAPGEAVSVTRRLYLSGESEYQLNGKTCRLRDIQDLFAGTGLSGGHYALIEQGKIGQILSSKPSDRRNLIEEAAGISKFRTRQRAAETRLESAKSNLNRISDIVSEIDKQANSLRRQAAKTRRYKILREEFRATLRQTFSAEGKYLSKLINELETKLDEATKTERAILRQVAEKDEAFRQATKTARETEENLSELRAAHSENALQRDRNQREQRYQQEQISNLDVRSNVLKEEIETIEQRLELFKTEIERLEKEEKAERIEAEKVETSLREVENKYQAKIKDLREIEAKLERERAELMTHTAAVERFNEIERQLENTLERLKERLEGLKREGERAAETRAEHFKEAGNIGENLSAEREKISKLHKEKQDLLVKSGEARTTLQNSEKILKDLREKFSRTKHRLETLQELEEKRTIYAPTVQKLFAEQTKIGVNFLGTLADKLNVDEKAEKAVENLFGNFLQMVLVETEEDARKTIDYLNENNVGRIAILIFNAKTQKMENGKRKTENKKEQIRDSLGISEEFAEILEEIFPREMSAKLVEDFDYSEKSDENFATFAGDLNFGGKLFIGGKANANEKNNSLLAFKRELRELKSNSEKLAKEIEKAEKETEKARKILVEKENEIVDLQSLIVKVERELLSLEIQEKSIKQEIERAERHKKVVGEETKQIENELAEIQQKQKDAKLNAEKAEKARNVSAENSVQITQKLNDARTKAESENIVLNEKKTLAATSNERRRSAQNALRRVENEFKELNSRLARQNLEILEIEGKQKDLIELMAETARKTTDSENEQESEQNELVAAAAHLKSAREQEDVMSSELAELNKKSAEARNERAAFEIRQAETLTKLRNVHEKCLQDLNLSLAELVENTEIETDFDFETAREKVDDLRGKLENFGAINMLALEELAEIEERFLFLTSQRQDIIDSISAAEAALREIKERSRERFRDAFAKINHNFTEFFQELFGGGKGEMTLLEADDVLEAGIEIVAQPPGKRLQNILLLSGGEKAMAAIALVLAIFRYRPAPFCLLDEVDAPLDDANVGRFVNKIAEMSEKTQFIVITHNKRTMEAAKALYGVTMQEAGISKVVSVRFE